MRPISFPFLSFATASLLCLASLPVAAFASAPPEGAEASSTSSPISTSQSAGDRHNQRIERIHFADHNAQVDELRVGGQTQSISVRPQNRLPAYEVAPADAGRSRHAGDGQGRRTWKALQF
ncbi:MAG: hypothetical protein KIG95_07140 [Comamonas sp.]|nr:hypothetical protein [Comamonas sp.]